MYVVPVLRGISTLENNDPYIVIVAESASTARSIAHREEPAPHDGRDLKTADNAESVML